MTDEWESAPKTPTDPPGTMTLRLWPVKNRKDTTMSDEPTTLQKVEATVWGATKAMAASKKFQAAVLSGALWGLGHLGLKIDASELAPIVGPLWLYIFGQGLADFGKSASKGGAS